MKYAVILDSYPASKEDKKLILDIRYKIDELFRENREVFNMRYFSTIHDLLKRIVKNYFFHFVRQVKIFYQK